MKSERAPGSRWLSSDVLLGKVPWNRDKILAELDRERIPKGAEKAILDRPDLAVENLCYALENGGSHRLLFNCLWLLPRLLVRHAIEVDLVEKALLQIHQHRSSEESSVQYSACRSSIIICFMATAYPHLNIDLEARREIVIDSIRRRPELEDELATHIRAATCAPDGEGTP